MERNELAKYYMRVMKDDEKEEKLRKLKEQKKLLKQGITDTGEMHKCIKYIKSINNGGSVSSINPPYFGLLMIPLSIRIPSMLKLQIVAIPTLSLSLGCFIV